MSIYNPINAIKKKYTWNAEIKFHTNIRTYFIKKLEYLYSRSYNSFC